MAKTSFNVFWHIYFYNFTVRFLAVTYPIIFLNFYMLLKFDNIKYQSNPGCSWVRRFTSIHISGPAKMSETIIRKDDIRVNELNFIALITFIYLLIIIVIPGIEKQTTSIGQEIRSWRKRSEHLKYFVLLFYIFYSKYKHLYSKL